MSSKETLRARVINLFPSQVVRKHFNEKGNLKDFIGNIIKKPDSELWNFIFTHHNHTKQNIYFTILKSLLR